MALNKSQVNVGTGPALGLDDCGVTAGNVQLIKPVFGVEGTATLVTPAAPLPVDGQTINVGTAWTKTKVNSAATSTLLLAANSGRKAVRIRNTDANALIISSGAAAATADNVIRLATNDVWIDDPASDKLAIQGIWEADGSGAALVEELS